MEQAKIRRISREESHHPTRHHNLKTNSKREKAVVVITLAVNKIITIFATR